MTTAKFGIPNRRGMFANNTHPSFVIGVLERNVVAMVFMILAHLGGDITLFTRIHPTVTGV